jgi:alkanesulfonate monooxygenase SsuD/methylene tetrahydromethanopterin reductase-like flavin-dependent oxidoreductase (luciferase family)
MQGIRIGLGMGDGGSASIDEIVARARRAEADGFATLWFANIFAQDAMTLAALVGRETEGAIRSLASAGVSDLQASPYPFGDDGAECVRRTTALLADLAKRS